MSKQRDIAAYLSSSIQRRGINVDAEKVQEGNERLHPSQSKNEEKAVKKQEQK
ncbi:Hypothetical predicted protein [Xyrichtys novacula]|uniref:Uncharacterized protein n=1 Tax=Xyrichtys novacula TaxID=13765 RepID=A0AAV1HAU5_XYRNO|nr:Hypothetical predicted protein [Xyrichtys novacula]